MKKNIQTLEEGYLESFLRDLSKEELLKKKHYSKAVSLKEMPADKIKELEKLYNCKIEPSDKPLKRGNRWKAKK